MTMNPHLDGALAWYDKGFCVIPAVADGTKKPFSRWKEFQNDRPTRQQVERWYKTAPAQGVGLVCGTVSGNLELLELEGRASTGWHLDQVALKCHELGVSYLWDMLNEDGYCESTPSGGFHFLYRISDHPVPGNQKVANRPPNAEESEAAPHLRSVTLAETRGEGGFVIVAPTSGTVHKSGEAWTCLAGAIGEIPTITWAEREALVQAIHEALDEEIPTPVVPPRPVGIPVDNGDGPGADFNRKESWEVLLPAYGWTFSHTYGGEHFWTRPGKDFREGHSASLYYQGSDNLYVWSSSTPLPTETPISKFAFVTFMDYAGDFSRCASDLRKQGFGGERPSYSNQYEWLEEIPTTVAHVSRPVPDNGASFMPLVAEVPADMVDRLSAPKFSIREHSETGVAHAVLNIHGRRFRNVSEEKGWRVYEDGVWHKDREAQVSRAVEDVTGRLLHLAEKLKNDADTALSNAKLSEDRELVAEAKEEFKKAEGFHRFALGCRSARSRNGIRTIFGEQETVAVGADRFDADKNLICFDNGVIDMSDLSVVPASDLELYPHAPEMMLTKKVRIKYDPQAQCPEWDRVLSEIVPDEAYRTYLQTAVGMTLLAEMRDAAFFVLHGKSGTGKSLFLNVMKAVLGDFAADAPPGTFRETRGKSKDDGYDLHSLRGVRMATMSETSEGAKLNEELIKRVTGGDAVKSRALYEDFQEWNPRFTMWMATNFLPNLNSNDGALWRRVKPVAFNVSQFEEGREPDTGLLARLKGNELPGIMNWVLAGVRMYLLNGLKDPQALKEALDDYRAETNPVVQFINESVAEGILVVEPSAKDASTKLYGAYVAWCRDSGQHPYGRNKFGTCLDGLGYEAHKGAGGIRERTGIKVNPHTWQAEAQGGGWQGRDTWRT